MSALESTANWAELFNNSEEGTPAVPLGYGLCPGHTLKGSSETCRKAASFIQRHADKHVSFWRRQMVPKCMELEKDNATDNKEMHSHAGSAL